MAKIYVDKYGNETTEGPQEGVIGAATGTHSSGGLTTPAPPPAAPAPAPAGPVPGQGPGHWEQRGFDLNPFGGHFNIDPTHRERTWVSDVANRWYRDNNGQWQNSGPAAASAGAAGPVAVPNGPMTVQQQKAAMMAPGAPETQINRHGPPGGSTPSGPIPGPPMSPMQAVLGGLPTLGQAPAPPPAPKAPPQWSSWMSPWGAQRIGG